MNLQRHYLYAVLGICLMLPATLLFAAQDKNIRQLSYGKTHLCLVTMDGELVCWGDNQFGQVGNGKGQRYGPENRELNPSLIIAHDVTAVSTGYSHTCAVVGDALDCWGANTGGQIGNGEIDRDAAGRNPKTPLRIITRGVKAVAAGALHTCAAVNETLQCWGANYHGQLGNGSTAGITLKPIQVIASGVIAVAAYEHTCAVVRGDLLCWGYNKFGQVGMGTTGADVLTPTKVISGGVTAVEVSESNTCALVKGALWCWGNNTNGIIIPDPTVENVASPRQVIPGGVTAVALGYGQLCAVVREALQCWGKNTDNKLGTGTRDEIVKSPREVIANGVTLISMGEWGSCAVVKGALRCRGHDPYRNDAITKADFSLFSEQDGDTLIDHSAADAVAEMEKSPARIAQSLKDSVIVHDNAAYIISKASGFLIKGFVSYGWSKNGDQVRNEDAPILNLNLNVIPLLPLTSQSASTSTSSTTTALTISPGSKCGLDATMPSRLDTTKFYLLQDDRLSTLQEVLQKKSLRLPRMDSADPRLQMGANDLRKLLACAQQMRVARARLPYETIQYQVDGEQLEVPSTLDGVRNLDVEGVIDQIYIEPKPGKTARYTTQIQAVVVMKCNGTVLNHWKEWLSPFVEYPDNIISLDQFQIVTQARNIPKYTQDELRLALNAEQGKKGPASEEEAITCLPAIRGEKIIVRYGTDIIQQFSAKFQQPKSVFDLECKQDNEAREQRTCKVLPNDPGKSIVALTSLGSQTVDAEDPSMGDYDLNLFIVKTGSHQVYSRYSEKKAYTSDAVRFNGLDIDTGRYVLAPGVRAFGVRASHSGSSRVNPYGETTLKLFVHKRGRLQQVLVGLVVDQSRGESDGNCAGEFAALHRTIDMGSGRSHGFSDLIVRSTVTASTNKLINNECVEIPQKPLTQNMTLHFDGEKYVIPGALLTLL